MITKISLQNPDCANYNTRSVHKNISFGGLTDRMGKKIYNGFYEMTELFPKENMQSPISGKLPGFMVRKIQARTTEIGAAIKEVMDAFGKTCRELRAFDATVNSTAEEIKFKRNNSTVKDLREVLTKWGILGKFDDFDIQYIDKGGKGSVYKFEGLKYIDDYAEDEYVMKVFHSTSVQTNAYHGCFPEINAATYWMKKFGYETNRGKFFWGDVKNAYMINKFIDEDVRLPKTRPNPYDHGVKFTDEDLIHIHNVCKGYSYDWGGGVVINQSVNSNNFARSIMHKIKNADDKYRQHDWFKLLALKTNGNDDNKNAGLALAIRFLPKEIRTKCFERCFEHRGKYNDRAMAYTLKYLPYDIAVKYYEGLAGSAKDKVLKKILRNEIPFLSVKDEYKSLVTDDILSLQNISSGVKEKFDSERFNTYTQLAEAYCL